MTTVAWDGKTLAADSQVTIGNCRGSGTKLVSNAAGYIAAGAGMLGDVLPWLQWVANGMDDEDRPSSLGEESVVIIVPPRGAPLWFAGTHIPTKLPRHKFAIGSGGDFAMGAMAMGADAVAAVKIAAAHDVYTGRKVIHRTRK